MEKLLAPFVDFIRAQATGGFLLVAGAILALCVATFGMESEYQFVKELSIGVFAGEVAFGKTLLHWVNDGLMAIFFFVLGLEIKRELLVGQLKDSRRAMAVIAAALGGMALPALGYSWINGGSPYSNGWGIPTATDTAFALAVLVFLRDRIPDALRAFLVGLAIVDDLGAIMIVAVFYTETVQLSYAGIAACMLLAGAGFNVTGIRHWFPYALLGVGMWLAFVGAGVHGTIAGVTMAGLAPIRPIVKQHKFVELVKARLARFQRAQKTLQARTPPIIESEEQQKQAEAIRDAAVMVTPPLKRWERSLDRPVALGILPLFAFLNAGIPMSSDTIVAILDHPVAHGILLGLLVGKPTGVVVATYVAVRLGICDLPAGISFRHVAGIGMLAAIGFTMSIFIGDLAFADDADALIGAKGAILVSSALAAALSFAWFRFIADRHHGPNNA